MPGLRLHQSDRQLLKYHGSQVMLQYVRQELTKAGLGDEHADAFLSKLRRSILARPDAGLAAFHEFCCRLEVNEEEVCGQAR